MRVAIVCPYGLDRPGGVQSQVVGLAAALRRLDHSVTVVAPGRPEAVRAMGIADDVVLVGPATGVPANGSVAPVALSPLAVRRAARHLERGDYDVVHLHEPFAPAIAYGWLLRPARPTVATLHRSGGDALYRVLGPLGRFAASRIDLACAVSEAARRTAAPSFRSEVPVLFNGVALPERHGPRRPGPGSACPGVGSARPASGPVTLFLSRHEPRKGLAVLLEAWRSGGLPGECWVLSDGAQTPELRRRFQGVPGVRWLGVVDQDRKADLLASADVVCAPSLGGESFGMVLLEGMANRCVVVASDISGYREAAAGLASLVPPADPTALRSGLAGALSDVGSGTGRASPDALDAAAAHAAGWSMGTLARRYVEYYAEAVLRH